LNNNILLSFLRYVSWNVWFQTSILSCVGGTDKMAEVIREAGENFYKLLVLGDQSSTSPRNSTEHTLNNVSTSSTPNMNNNRNNCKWTDLNLNFGFTHITHKHTHSYTVISFEWRFTSGFFWATLQIGQ
jgi:hypothetical protein